jgi:DNA-binding transcriptional ArsR family regulator
MEVVRKSDVELERVMKAFANRRRIAAVRIIKHKKEMTVGNLSDELRLSFKATSKHLSVLTAAGILDKEQRSIQMFFSLAPDMPESARRIVALL